MRATAARMVAALCAGRPAATVATRLGIAFASVTLLYAAGCVFLVLEPRP